MDKQYICECGKIFTNPQSFNGHKSHCKEHLGEEKYNKNLKDNTDRLVASSKKRSLDLIREKQEKYNQWLSEQHKCEKCGKVITEKYGSGRFCSKSCANSRQHSEETKNKMSIANKGKIPYNKNKILSKTIYYCSICGKQLRRKTKTGFCQDCLNNSDVGKQYRADIGKVIQEKLIASGKHIGWQSRNILSYPEKFWISVLNNNNIPFQPNYPIKQKDNVNYYFLDFYIEKNDKKIDLEIDGKQHKYEDRIWHDIIRDEYIKSLGYIIYRIDWNEINSKNGKQLIETKIKDFIDFYNLV